ncbi:MAG TPA: hypothetical protein VNS10_00115 [Gemmatimonadaceae bacterium]|nr:hypothetical protein [Gemmatimonadaceae bacterium]
MRLTIGGARTLAVALVAAILTACGSDSPSGPGTATSPEGNYTISTINGKALPMAVFSDTGGYKLEVLTGTLGVQGGGKYSVVTNYRQTIAGIVSTYSDSSGGNWLQTGATVAFTDGSDGSKVQAAWSNTGTLTIQVSDSPPISIVYALKK